VSPSLDKVSYVTVWNLFSHFNCQKHKQQSIYKHKALLKHIVDYAHYFDWSGRRETPAGKAGLGRPRKRNSAVEAPGPPAECECLERKSTGKLTQPNTKKQQL
jgi:hypothetical protein